MSDIINPLFCFVDKYPNLWAFVTALCTVLIAYIAWSQLHCFNKTAKADFIHRFKNDFFKEPTQEIMNLLDYSALKFGKDAINYSEDIPSKDIPYFLVDKSVADQLRIKVNNQRTEYTVFEMDDNLLGHFEDLGSFEKQSILDISHIYDWFSYYIALAWEDEEIQKYIKWQRTEDESAGDIYENFEYIYKKCKSFGAAKRNRQWIWFWKLKWFLCNQ